MRRQLLGRICLWTLLIWFTTAVVLLIYVMGECLPPDDRRCPTIAEEQRTMLTILLAGIIASIGTTWREVRISRRKNN